ncbi:hypothetical protein OsJ_24046 [Oryza sativa Japonica Group]|uniref:Uncharacterized protein n=1 Tax=Oryza sativa subsp. japonica TaxID=39947 RepID=A3BJ74_ORYSJ|nr:hypothetical protein OsJ_24046 [Oryza sativa Japonica Group]
MAAKTSTTTTTLLRLRSSEGKVLVAPAWDGRPSATAAAAAAPPLETRVPLRALEKAVLFWVGRALAEAIGGKSGDRDWEAHFLRCLQQDGLAAEDVAAAVEKLRGIDALAGVVPDFTLAAAAAAHRHPSSSAAPETSASCHSHSNSRADASPDRAAASRARGRQRREEEEEEAADRGHRKTRQAGAAASDDGVQSSGTSAAAAAATTGASLRGRRGLPELHALQVNNSETQTLLAWELLLV